MHPREALELSKRYNIILDASVLKEQADRVAGDTTPRTPRSKRVTEVCCQAVLHFIAPPANLQKMHFQSAVSPYTHSIKWPYFIQNKVPEEIPTPVPPVA